MLAAWWRWAALFAALLTALAALSALRTLARWARARRAGRRLALRTWFRLRWRGLDPAKIARAHWAVLRSGYESQLELIESLAIVGVSADRLASAVETASAAGTQVHVAALGAAAMAGYDPVAVAEAAIARGAGRFTVDDLPELEQWGLARRDRPV